MGSYTEESSGDRIQSHVQTCDYGIDSHAASQSRAKFGYSWRPNVSAMLHLSPFAGVGSAIPVLMNGLHVNNRHL